MTEILFIFSRALICVIVRFKCCRTWIWDFTDSFSFWRIMYCIFLNKLILIYTVIIKNLWLLKIVMRWFIILNNEHSTCNCWNYFIFGRSVILLLNSSFVWGVYLSRKRSTHLELNQLAFQKVVFLTISIIKLWPCICLQALKTKWI